MRIEKLKITLKSKVLVDIAFDIKNSLALVGQSGSGKSLTLKALLGMLPHGMDLELELDAPFELGCSKSLSLVVQNPFTALSPLTKIKRQFFTDKKNQKKLLGLLGLDESILERYPPQLSGGQLQRVVIAMALESNPKLLLLDEPTTALDPQTTQMILDLLKKLQQTLGFKILFVTHDIISAAVLCEDICVINNGLVVEDGKMSEVLSMPKQKYTKTLIDANFTNREFRK